MAQETDPLQKQHHCVMRIDALHDDKAATRFILVKMLIF